MRYCVRLGIGIRTLSGSKDDARESSGQQAAKVEVALLAADRVNTHAAPKAATVHGGAETISADFQKWDDERVMDQTRNICFGRTLIEYNSSCSGLPR